MLARLDAVAAETPPHKTHQAAQRAQTHQGSKAEDLAVKLGVAED